MSSGPVISTVVAVFALVAFACGSDAPVITDSGTTDTGTDGGGTGTPVDIPWLAAGAPPVGLTPCPDGWREVPGAYVTECDPYPESGPEACGAGEAHFPGEPGCRPVGAACPAGDYATDLPSTGEIIYVKAGADPGGDGSLASPYGALSEVAWLSVTSGTTVALGKGTYAGTLPLRAGARVVGACARETIVSGSDAPVLAVISVVNAGGPAVVQNLTIADAPQIGAVVTTGRGLTLDGVIIEGPRGAGVVATGSGTVLSLDEVVVHGVLAVAGVNSEGRGVRVDTGAHLDAARVIISANRDAGLFVSDGGTVASLTDSVIRDTLPRQPDGRFGVGLGVLDGAQFEASRLLVSGNRRTGILVEQSSTAVTLNDVVVRDTLPQESDRSAGFGILVHAGAHLDGSRVVVSENHDFGVVIGESGTTSALTDAVIRGNRAVPGSGLGGNGLAVQSGAVLDATRLLVSDNRETGVTFDGRGTVVTFTDVAVRDMLPRMADGQLGRGVQVQRGARLEGDRIVVAGATQVGLMAVGGATVDVRDYSSVDVSPTPCGSTTCPEDAYGYAAAAISATIRLEQFQIRNAATCGVFVAPVDPFYAEPEFEVPPSLDLVSGVIFESEIGACVQVPEYDFSRLTNDVHYSANGTNLDTTMLPVPRPVGE